MNWTVEFTENAKKDLKKLDGSVKKQVLAGIAKVCQNPVAKSEGGYGRPLGNKGNRNLTGYYEVKFRRIGIRAIYRLIYEEAHMRVVVISARADEEVFELANWRRNNA